MSLLVERARYFAEIQEYLVDGARDMFSAYGLTIEYRAGGVAQVDGPAVMAVIGYASEDIRGALLLMAPPSVVMMLRPKELRALAPHDDILRDMLGEFANMLLGRIKNQLVPRALAPFLSTPTTVCGANLRLPAPTSGMSAWHTFATGSEDIYVRFDATFEAGFVLGPPRPGSTLLKEGEMVMFEVSEV